MQDQARVPLVTAVVDHRTAEQHGVGDIDFLILERTDTGIHGFHIHHLTLQVPDADPVALAEGAAVYQAVTGDDIGDERRGTDGQDHTEENTHALEGFRVGAGNVGIGNHQPEHDDHHPHDAIGRQGQVPIKGFQANPAAVHPGEESVNDPQEKADHHHQHRQERQVRQRRDQTRAHFLQGIQYQAENIHGQRTRPGIQAQGCFQPHQHQQEQHQRAQPAQYPPQPTPYLAGVDDAVRGLLNLLQLPFQAPLHQPVQPAKQRRDRPVKQRSEQGDTQQDARVAQQSFGRAHLAVVPYRVDDATHGRSRQQLQ